ncbi:MAG: Uma2 family endonuclease [Candidatus Kapaibacterium sp.]|nr:MAG: Uma2 family endonuclease [Candidatus Kapabacteria bacterium]
MLAIAQKYTLADYEALPEGAPYQLIHGELVVSPTPTVYHQKVLGHTFYEIAKFVERNEHGEVFASPIDVYFNEDNAYQPDVVFVSTKRLDIIGETNIQGAPDLVVEVLSSNAKRDLVDKKDVYEAFGVKEYWILDPERKSIDVLENTLGKYGNEFRLYSRARNGEGAVESKVLAGLSVEAAYIFAPLHKK